ncbi:MAG TPA: hypothetical protein VD994_19610 [Prosthecobacter sp.]|nr:hypothetical protein [Prosthecobacter sp.]
MKDDIDPKIALESPFTREEMERRLQQSLDIVRRIEMGEITREEGIQEMVSRGGTSQSAKHFLLHTLDQTKLDKLKRDSGAIID